MSLPPRLLVALVVLLATTGAASADALRALWDEVTPVAGVTASAARCNTGPAPVVTLATETRYDLNDKNRTEIDPARSATYEAAVAPVRDFSRLVVGYANTYAISRGADVSAALCAATAMLSWAKAGAMLDVGTDVAQFNRATFLAAVASAYVQVRASGVIPEDKQEIIRQWLDRLAVETLGFYQRKRDAEHVPPNNIQHWAGLGVAMAGVAINDRNQFDWGLEALSRGVCIATPEGALPPELKRQERALHYHVFALSPLVALAELGERNGIPSYGLCNGVLHRIISFALAAFDDPAVIEALAGARQLPESREVTSSATLAWLEIYAQRFPAFAWANRMKAIRPLNSTNLGGRLTRLYGVM